jgi:YjjG family noncanonical pyrimidine nucleotidase
MSVTGMVKKYKCVFFDLDHTLWDYEANCREALYELYDQYSLSTAGVSDAESFYLQFRKVNHELWELYDTNQIDQEYIRRERFKRVLDHFLAYEEKLAADLTRDYLIQSPRKANLIAHAEDVLSYLSDRYSLTVVTNGFDEIQQVKLTSGNLHRFFRHIVTSQKAGHRKPSQGIFDYAMKANGIQCCDAVMIGDNLVTDIGGARNASIDTIFYNPQKVRHEAVVSHEIGCLSELKNIL